MVAGCKLQVSEIAEFRASAYSPFRTPHAQFRFERSASRALLWPHSAFRIPHSALVCFGLILGERRG